MKHCFLEILFLLFSCYSFGGNHLIPSERITRKVISNIQEGNLSFTASVITSSERNQYGGINAIDGNLDSYWKADNSEGWIMLDLKKPYELKSICQIFQQSSLWKFKVEGSVDKKDWLILVDKTKGVAGDIFKESVTGTYRYVKLTILGSTDGLKPSSQEFVVEGMNTGENIALGKSVVEALKYHTHGYADALDDNTSTYWEAKDESFPQSLTVDLGGLYLLSGVQQVFTDYDEWKYIVQGSNDKLYWYPLVDNSKGIKGFDFKTAVSGHFRYVRLMILESAKGHKANSCEFRVFKDVSVEPMVDCLKNLSFNVQCTTSSFYGNEYAQMKAVDGDENSFWYADNGDYPQWLCADLGLPCEVKQLKQVFADSDVWSFIIEGSNDKKRWEILADCKKGMAGDEYIADVNGIYRYIRLVVLNAKNKSKASSRMFQVKGFGSPRNTAWWEETSGMTRYYPKYYRQSLSSIKDSLDILQRQGYRAIELSAIYEGEPSVWAGLGSTNNYDIDPSIGSLSDFKDLLSEVHKRGMYLTFFGNVGYCWHEAPFFVKACDDQRAGIYSKERNWFHFSDKKLDDKWFWSEKAQSYYYSFWGNSDGAKGRIPSYNFRNKEWQEECRNYLNYWADMGVDGILLDAPEVYDGITDNIINESIIKTLNRRGILTSAEGSSDISKWIGRFGFRFIQGFDLYGWGGGKKSEVLRARRMKSPSGLDDKLKSYRDLAVSLGATTITPPMWEIKATEEERLFELAFLVSTGSVVINHYGDHHSDYIAQLILSKWSEKDQERFYNLIRLQNSYAALSPMGQRVCIPTNDDMKYIAFKRSNKNGKISALVFINFQDKESEIKVNLRNTGLRLGQRPVNLLDKNKCMPVLSDEYQITLPAYGCIILGVQNNM